MTQGGSVTKTQQNLLVERFGADIAGSLSSPYHSVFGWRVKWWLPDGELGGALSVPGVDAFLGEWQQEDEQFGFGAGTRFLILDFHIDDAMAFLIDGAQGPSVVLARAGEEGDAIQVVSRSPG